MTKTTDEDWQRMLDLNLTAPFRCVRRALLPMQTRGSGRIVVIASVAAKIGEPYIAAYTASKHGVLGLVRSAAAELDGSGVTINAICPGYVDTPMTDATIAGIVERTGRTADEARAILAAKQPSGRLVSPDEVVDAVWACVVDGSINGQGIDVLGDSSVVTLERINPDGLADPRGFSHAVVGEGKIVFLAGQTAMDATGRIVGEGVVAQFEQALGNLLVALRAAGGEPHQLASLTIFIVDVADYRAHVREIGEIWRRLVGTDYPAMAGIGISRLWDEEALVEVQGFAVL